MINVLCAIITNSNNEIFIARRASHKSQAGKWEFPGGKLEDNETEEDCIQRELHEELGMKVKVLDKFGENVHHYPNTSIRLIAYNCTFISATYEQKDHDEYIWIQKSELHNYDFAKADIPFIERIVLEK